MDGSHFHIDSTTRLCAVVVSHQRLDKLKITLGRLLETPAHVLQRVVVVDNASDPAIGAWLRRQADPRLHVELLTRNIGGAGGFEWGMRVAMRRYAPDWIVVMDDDGRPDPGALERFAELDLRDWDGFAAAVRTPDGALADMNRPTFDPFRHPGRLLRSALGGGRAGYHIGSHDLAIEGTRPVDGASFVGFFVRGTVLAMHGGPNPDLFLYADDAFYTLGLTRAGYRIGFNPAVGFEHDTETYSPGDPRFRPLWRVYYYYRNLTALHRFVAGALFPAVLVVHLPIWLAKARHYRGSRGVYLRLLTLALRDGLAGHTGRPHGEILALAERENRPSARQKIARVAPQQHEA
ncbi:MAG: glycosyltransferase [Paracoccaceae bacterium]